MAEIIKIHKAAGKKKDAVRINGVEDIPEFLRNSVDIARDTLFLDNVDVKAGEAYTCPLGSVVGYEESNIARSGWNCWCITNAATNLVEKDGVFYTKATILEAEPVTDEPSELMAGAGITWQGDHWEYPSKYGVYSAAPGEGYWVKSGTLDDGVTPKGYLLKKSEESYQLFIVCDSNGDDIGLLAEIDPA